MISLVSLLVAAALVSQHNGFEANALINNSKMQLDNNLLPNVIAAPTKKPRRLKKFVLIREPPVPEVRREAGDNIELVCIAMGNPPPSILWTKNGETVQSYEEEVNEIRPVQTSGLGMLTSKLIITAISPGDDMYTCEASAGKFTDRATSIVYTTPSEDGDFVAIQKLFQPTKPIITYFYEDLFLDQGSEVVLPCRVESLTKVKIFWQDSNDRLIYGNPRMKVLPSGDLFIHDLRWDDMGNFTCIAKNMYGKDSAATFVYPAKPSPIRR